MKTKNLKEYTNVGSLYVSTGLLKFVNNEILKGTKIKPKNFWNGFEKSLHILKPKNEKLIDIRESIQKKIDNWHLQNKDKEFNFDLPSTHNSFIYLIEGEIKIGNEQHQKVENSKLILLEKGDKLKVYGSTDAKFLLIAGKPIGEQIARGGPFVMNTKQEILQAVEDYHKGTFVK